MPDLAQVGLKADSSEIVKASKDLDGLSMAATRTTTATDKMNNQVRKNSQSVNQWARDVARGSQGITAANDNIVKSTGLVQRGFAGALASAKAFAVGAIAAFAFGQLISSAQEFSAAMAEVSTLLPAASAETGKIEEATHRLAREYASTATQQAKAFYQIISAGASDAAEATEILEAANRLAIGGVTDIITAADGLTSILNAYGDQVEGVTAVSDSMFIAMKAGKTTIGELSASLGKVAPLAAQSRVSFDELNAAIAALTKGGISTRESVTGLRAILAAVTKPTSEATKLAKQLGLEFNSSALQAKGLAGFLEDVTKATGGSSDQMAILFGGVEAIIPALALAGNAGKDFRNILEDMANKSGATAEAFEKVSSSLDFRFRKALAVLVDAALKLGNVLLAILVPAMEALAAIVETVINVFDALGITAEDVSKVFYVVASALAVVFAPAGLAIIKAFAVAIGVGLVNSVRAFTAAIIANPIGALITAIVAAVEATIGWKNVILGLIQFFQNLWETAKRVIAAIGEGLRAIGLTEFADRIEVWLNGSEAASQIERGHSTGGKRASDDVNRGHMTGGRSAASDILESHEKGGAEVAKAINGVNQSAVSAFDQAANRAAQIMEARLEAQTQISTARISADAEMLAARLQAQSADFQAALEAQTQASQASFSAAGIDLSGALRSALNDGGQTIGSDILSASTGAGKIIAEAIEAQLNIARQQAKLLIAQAEKTRAETDAIARASFRDRAGTGSGSAGGGGGGSRSASSGSGGLLFDRSSSAAVPENRTTSTTRDDTERTIIGPAQEGESLQIINVHDPKSLVNYMNSQEGRRVVVNTIAAEAEEIKSTLGIA